MAKKEHWEVDPWNQREMWLKVIGHDQEFPEETRETAHRIFDTTGARCLEIGAGVGRLLMQAQKYFFQPVGVDSSASLVAMSTIYLQDYPNCRVILNDGLTFPFDEKAFSFVYSFTCFQHMEEIETIRQNLREAYRVLRHKGLCKIQTVCGDRASGLYDGYVFASAEEFRKEFLDVGFEEVEAKVEGPWIWVKAWKGTR